jgi:hypothetical protein
MKTGVLFLRIASTVLSIVSTGQAQVFEMSCEFRTTDGQLTGKLPLFRPVIVSDNFPVPHPIGTDLLYPISVKGPVVLVGCGISTKSWRGH